MNDNLRRLLEHLAETLDAKRQAEVADLHRRALSYEPVPRLPLFMHYPTPPDAQFRPYPHSEVFDDPEKMLFNELICGFSTSFALRHELSDDLPLTIRANFGTVLIPSIFGANVEQVEENPPWVRHFETLDEFRAALDHDPLDFTAGWCPRVVERLGFYRATLA